MRQQLKVGILMLVSALLAVGTQSHCNAQQPTPDAQYCVEPLVSIFGGSPELDVHEFTFDVTESFDIEDVQIEVVINFGNADPETARVLLTSPEGTSVFVKGAASLGGVDDLPGRMSTTALEAVFADRGEPFHLAVKDLGRFVRPARVGEIPEFAEFAEEDSEGEWIVEVWLNAFAPSSFCNLDRVCLRLFEVRPPAPVEDLVCSEEESVVSVSWTNAEAYESVDVYVNGLLFDTVDSDLDEGESVTYETGELASPQYVDIRVVPVVDGVVGHTRSCRAPILGSVDATLCSDPDLFWDPDEGAVSDTISVDDDETVSDILVGVDISSEIDYSGLEVWLESPSGTQVQLHRLCRRDWVDIRACDEFSDWTISKSPEDYGLRSTFWALGRRNFPFFDVDEFMQASGPGSLRELVGEPREGDWILSFDKIVGLVDTDEDVVLNSWCLTFLSEGPGATSVTDLSCAPLSESGAFEISWTNTADYDEIRILIDDELDHVLVGPHIDGALTTTEAVIGAHPSYARFSVQGVIDDAPGPVVFCRARTLAISGLECSSVEGSGVADLSWESFVDFEEIQIQIDGALEATLAGDATEYTTAERTVPQGIAIEVTGILKDGVDASLGCTASLLGAALIEECDTPMALVDSQDRVTLTQAISDEFTLGTVEVPLVLSGPGAWGAIVELRSPDGTAVTLFKTSGPTDVLPSVVFGDRGLASDAVELDCECYARPVGPGDLEDLRGEPSAGDWELHAVNVDRLAIPFTVEEWCLRLSEACEESDLPTEFTAEETSEGVELSWKNDAAHESVEIFRGSRRIAEMGGDDSTYLDTSAPAGRLEYRISGRSDDDGCDLLTARHVIERGLHEYCEEDMALEAGSVEVLFTGDFSGPVAGVELFLDLLNDDAGVEYVVTLESPSGVRATLLEDSFSADADIRTTFTDEGLHFDRSRLATDLRMQPELPARLGAFSGEVVDSGDIWILEVAVGGDGATLNGACLRVYEDLCEAVPPSELECTVEPGLTEAVWDAGEASGFNLYVDGHQVASLDAGTDSHEIEGLLPGTHSIELQGLADGLPCVWSRLQCDVEIELDRMCEEPGTVIDPGEEVSEGIEVDDEGPILAVEVDLELPTTPDTWLIALESPSETEIILHDHRGAGSGFDVIYSDIGHPGDVRGIAGLFDCACRVQPQGPGTFADFVAEEASGDWTLRLAQDAAGEESLLSGWCLALAIGCDASPPEVLSCVSSTEGVELSWANSDDYDEIVVLRNGVEVAALESTLESYVDTAASAGSVRHRVVGVVDDCRLPSDVCLTEHRALQRCGTDLEAAPSEVSRSASLEFSLRFEMQSVEVEVVASEVQANHRLELESPWGTRVVLSDWQAGWGLPDMAAGISTVFAADGAAYAAWRLPENERIRGVGPGHLADLAGELSVGPQAWTLHYEGLGEIQEWCLRVYPADGQVLSGFRRGDTNGDNTVSALPDALYLFEYGFLDGAEPPCLDAADVDDSGDVSALPDGLYLLRWGFADGASLPAPGESCGGDPTVDKLGCSAASCP